MHDLQRWCKYTFTYPSLLQEYSYLRKQVRSHDTVSKVAYVSNFTYVSKCVHVNGALDSTYHMTLKSIFKKSHVLRENFKILASFMQRCNARHNITLLNL